MSHGNRLTGAGQSLDMYVQETSRVSFMFWLWSTQDAWSQHGIFLRQVEVVVFVSLCRWCHPKSNTKKHMSLTIFLGQFAIHPSEEFPKRDLVLRPSGNKGCFISAAPRTMVAASSNVDRFWFCHPISTRLQGPLSEVSNFQFERTPILQES